MAVDEFAEDAQVAVLGGTEGGAQFQQRVGAAAGFDPGFEPGGEFHGPGSSGSAEVALAAGLRLLLPEVAEEELRTALILFFYVIQHGLDPFAIGAPEHFVAVRAQLYVTGAQAVVLNEEHGGVIGGDVAHHVVHAELIQQLPQHGDRYAAAGGHGIFVDGGSKGENARVHAHERFQHGGHGGIGKLYGVE